MRKSKAQIVVELLGPSPEVERIVGNLVSALRDASVDTGVQVNYPEPLRITPILRNRKKAAPKPDRKAKKANSQQPEAPSGPISDYLVTPPPAP